jgi:pimeloyl-ACP methyl ester carboxylesterase
MAEFEAASAEVREVPAGGFVGDPQLFGGQLLPQVEKHVIEDAAHWLQQEKPDEVNALLVPWLERNFGG